LVQVNVTAVAVVSERGSEIESEVVAVSTGGVPPLKYTDELFLLQEVKNTNPDAARRISLSKYLFIFACTLKG
jgi:hypothetical protein